MPTAPLRNSSLSYDVDAIGNDASSTRRGNALSNKVTNVLSSSYADSEIRDALRLYDARYGDGPDQDLDISYEAQKEVIEANARIVDDFSKVAKQLNRVGTLIATLNQTCDDIRKHVLAAKQETQPMLEEASALLAQKQETEKKQQLLDSFCRHFLISDEDLTTLTSSAEPLDERFFGVLSRVKQIHNDCELLLGYENQRLGLELMEQTTWNLNAGYKKLFNSTLRDFKGLDLEDPHISGSIRRSLRALSERPALFQSCLDSFAEARQLTVAEAFQKALTDSTTTGTARAIDFSTHDPLRYIGDMLAWVHSATVSEIEALEGLFISDADEISRGLYSGKIADPFSMPTEEREDTRFDSHAALISLISRNMASVSQTLTQRISVTIRSLSDPVEIYKAYNILSFYHDMFLKLLRHAAKPTPESLDDNTILSTLTTLQSQTFKHFETTTLEILHSSIDDQPNADLSPPPALPEALSQFTKIAQTRGPNLDMTEFAKLYSTFVKPVVDSCKTLSEILEAPATAAGHEASYPTAAPSLTYRLNYMSLVRDTLHSLTTGSSPIEAANSPLSHAQNEIAILRTSLTGLLRDTFISISGLEELQDQLADFPAGASAHKQKKHLLRLAHTSGQEPELMLETLAGKLDTFLASALMDAQDDLSKISDREVATSVIRSAVATFCTEFEKVVQRLEDIDEGIDREKLAKRMGKSRDTEAKNEPGNESEDDEADDEAPALRDIYPRTLDEVRALLS